jgi:hypothetical protein
MVAMQRQLSLIKEDWPYSLIAHMSGMSLLSIFGHKSFLLTADFNAFTFLVFKGEFYLV